MPELEVSGPEAEAARQFYCGTIGVEFMHIPEREKRQWIQERMEAEFETPAADRERILDWLVRAEIFEQVLQTRYLGTKRYSLEGESALLPLAGRDFAGRFRARSGASGAGDEPSRTAERDGARRGARGGGSFRAI